MEKVKINKAKLLKKVKDNRKQHRDLFLKAQEGFRADVIEELDRALERARNGEVKRFVSILPEPQDHTKDYDRVITMLEMSVDTNIELDEEAFKAYVMDDWVWKGQALATNTMYAAKMMISKGGGR